MRKRRTCQHAVRVVDPKACGMQLRRQVRDQEGSGLARSSSWVVSDTASLIGQSSRPGQDVALSRKTPAAGPAPRGGSGTWFDPAGAWAALGAVRVGPLGDTRGSGRRGGRLVRRGGPTASLPGRRRRPEAAPQGSRPGAACPCCSAPGTWRGSAPGGRGCRSAPSPGTRGGRSTRTARPPRSLGATVVGS